MKNTKKNNKGFSLVELIVVVLIMAIIAVALAPQVMKWVNNSRLATDRQTADAIVSAAELALIDTAAYTEVTGATADTTITLKQSGIVITPGTSGKTAFQAAFCEALGLTNASSSTTPALKSGDTSTTITITVSHSTGKVSSNAETILASSDLD